MKDGQLFRVKVIKDESDLPKEEGLYLAHDINLYHTKYTSFAPLKPNDIGVYYVRPEWWMNNIDWYLIPEPEPKEKSVEIRSDKWHGKSKGKLYLKPQKENNWLEKSTMKNPDFFEQRIKDEITDEDIEAWIMDEYSLNSDTYILGVIKGAKAFRDRFTPTNKQKDNE